eukprot:Tbor_TRINITY_DN5737_c1_g1::TRINITY_DN5737_c1_g1_i9::g.19667::m.19667
MATVTYTVVYISPYAATAILKHCRSANANEAPDSKLGYITGNNNIIDGSFTITNILPIVQADLSHLIPFSPNDSVIIGMYANGNINNDDVKLFAKGKKNRLFITVILPSESNNYKLQFAASIYSDLGRDGQNFNKNEIKIIKIKYDSIGSSVVMGAVLSELYPEIKEVIKNNDLLSLESHINIGNNNNNNNNITEFGGAVSTTSVKKSTKPVEEMLAALEEITQKEKEILNNNNNNNNKTISDLRKEIRG